MGEPETGELFRRQEEWKDLGKNKEGQFCMKEKVDESQMNFQTSDVGERVDAAGG